MAATETIGPFDGTPWAQDQWFRYAAAWTPSGVLDAPQSSPSAGALGLSFSGLTPTLAVGRAWVRGGGYELSGGSKTLAAVPPNTNASLQRRDRLVLRRDLAAKTLEPTLIQGTPSASPSAPSIQQNEAGQWDLPLFSFQVPPNSGTAITGIVDERVWTSPDGNGRLGRVLTGSPLGPYTVPVADDNPRNIGQLVVPDPGWPYRLRTYGGVEITSSGARCDTFMLAGSTTWDLVEGSVFYHKHSGISPVLTGAQTLFLVAMRVPGAGSGTWNQSDANTNFSLTAEVVPA